VYLKGRCTRKGGDLVGGPFGGDPERRTAQPAQTDRGTRTINDAVVISLPAQMVQEIVGAEPEIGGRGATTIPGDTSPTMGELTNRVYGGNRGACGISVETG
jgi:hypothetical protein